jgi:hypothetical protein
VNSGAPSRAEEPRAPAEHVEPKPRAQFEPSPPAAPSAEGSGQSSGAKPCVVWSSAPSAAPSSGTGDRGRED